MMGNESEILRLRRRVEACFGAPLSSSRHFDGLCESIYQRTGVLLSPTTLKRLWGYLREPVQPRLYTLDVLSRYAGWPGWQAFCSSPKTDDAESGPIGNPYIDVKGSLASGDTVLLTWPPGRVCRIRFKGADCFEVVEAQGTRLMAGDTFHTARIISGAPLYLDHLTREGSDMGTYVCGSKSGVCYVVERKV